MGKVIWEKYKTLPFLFKVLSIETALSIQAHPDKTRAQRLNLAFPKIYTDPNHKPEMAIALTPFEAFLGFRPLEEISNFLRNVPAFRIAVGEAESDSFLAAQKLVLDITAKKLELKKLFEALQRQSPWIISAALTSLLAGPSLQLTGMGELITRLNNQYPEDSGIFCAFFLNYIKLEKGTSIFLAAGEPHAYISGDCVECMASSDNVVRCGLTPKLKDVDTLLEMLTVISK